jgi:hypothetical protein
MTRLNAVDILGLRYRITYVNSPSDVDINKHTSFWGQIDYWTRTIRIYQKGRSERDIFETLMHEVLHGIAERLNLKSLEYSVEKSDIHSDLDLLSIAITDVLCANGLLSFDAVEGISK